MDEQTLAEALLIALDTESGVSFTEALEEATGDADTTSEVTSFRRAGLLTNNEGVVLRLSDGTEFQISITQSN